ncbi:hypothetical protein E4L98_16545 [Duganella callida]|uniref:Nucleotidyltransferase family protein n=1 Tax=Duganella callida TaxID=2561932 RepID=A0A4Y9SEA8_9BURK|nr:hypothetical protein E4L98_16545 [Duganella callida]
MLQAYRQPQRLADWSAADWDLLLRQSVAAYLLAGLLALVEEHGLLARLPDQVREHLEWARTLAERHQQGVRYEVAMITRALAGCELPLILLKGAAYTMAGLPAARGRLYSDVDILVPAASLPDVEAALMMHGWAATHHDAYDQRYYRVWMHELPPMRHVLRNAVIDVHHAILPLTARVRPDPDKLRAAAAPIAGAEGLYTLAPADLVLHSAVHLFYDGEFDHGLRDLVDIHRLLLHFGADPAFWPALTARAAELQLARPLFYALRYCAQLLHTPVPADAVRAAAGAAPGPLLLGLMDFLFHRALLPVHASCNDRWSAPARFCLYLRGNWLRMPPPLLARHLFHKAFLSPKEAKKQRE